MRQCAKCQQPTEEQWLNRFTLIQHNSNTHITDHIYVCNDCEDEHSYFSLETEEGIFFIEYKNKKYQRNTYS